MAGKIIGGDFKNGTIIFDDLRLGNGTLGSAYESLRGNVASVELITEQNKKKFLSSAAWGVAGAALGAVAGVGVIGAAAGVLAGGNKKEVCFACYLKDGRKFMAVTDASLHQKVVAETMRNSAPTATSAILKRREAEQRAIQQAKAKKRQEEWEAQTPLEKTIFYIAMLLIFGGFAYCIYYVNTT